MSTAPSGQSEPPRSEPVSYTIGTGGGSVVRMPVPGNAELIVYLVAVLVAGIVALTTSEVDGWRFLWATTLLTMAYLVSRGIAKASRVLER